ncbi:MAG: PEP-CTERM sorting domain-containing protein [Gammaproteobacteria bacterium]|jgi:hypothetical protein
MKFITKVSALFLLLFGVYGQALAIPVISGDGTETCVSGTPLGGASCAITLIDDHNLWKQNGDADLNGAVWISYANTGVGGDTLAPLAGTTTIFTVIETFEANVGDMLNLDVWADDTAGVSIDSISLFSPNFTQNICANGSIGCEPDEFGNISYTFNTSGTHSLSFDVYQVGTGTNPDVNPFGLLYSGTLTTVPEPSVLALLGLGLFGLGLARRKNQ